MSKEIIIISVMMLDWIDEVHEEEKFKIEFVMLGPQNSNHPRSMYLEDDKGRP